AGPLPLRCATGRRTNFYRWRCSARPSLPPFKASLRTVRLDEIVACFLEVLADQGMRLLRIALVERVEDAAMLSIVVVYHIGREDLLLHRVPLRMQPYVIDLPIDIDEQGIAGRMRYQEVEFAVPLGELVLVVERLLGMSEHHLHVVEILPRRVQHCKTRGERLDG